MSGSCAPPFRGDTDTEPLTPIERKKIMSDGDRKIVLTRASDIKPAPAWQSALTRQIKDVVRDVLPDDWQVLPDGREAASVIAMRVLDGP